MLFQLPIYHQNKGTEFRFYSAISMYIYLCYLYYVRLNLSVLHINTYNTQIINDIYKYTYKYTDN